MKVEPIGEPYQGVQTFAFLCPGCADRDEPDSRLHASHTFNSTWAYNGDGQNPTVSPSILLTGHDGHVCHSFIKDGKIQFLADCSHSLAGQTVDLPERK